MGSAVTMRSVTRSDGGTSSAMSTARPPKARAHCLAPWTAFSVAWRSKWVRKQAITSEVRVRARVSRR